MKFYAPHVIVKRHWTENCPEGYNDVDKVLEAIGNMSVNAGSACCDEDYIITNVAWDKDYGSYGRMQITVTTGSCEGGCCYTGICGAGETNAMAADCNHFYLSADGTTEGTKSAEIFGAGMYYIEVAKSDLPDVGRFRIDSALAGA